MLPQFLRLAATLHWQCGEKLGILTFSFPWSHCHCHRQRPTANTMASTTRLIRSKRCVISQGCHLLIDCGGRLQTFEKSLEVDDCDVVSHLIRSLHPVQGFTEFCPFALLHIICRLFLPPRNSHAKHCTGPDQSQVLLLLRLP